MDTFNAMVHDWPWLFGLQKKSELINIGLEEEIGKNKEGIREGWRRE